MTRDPNSVEEMAKEIERDGLPPFAETFLDKFVRGPGFTMSNPIFEFLDDIFDEDETEMDESGNAAHL